jgi:hypothetical protein
LQKVGNEANQGFLVIADKKFLLSILTILLLLESQADTSDVVWLLERCLDSEELV